MTDKEKAVKELKSKGLSVIYDHGIPMVLYDKGQDEDVVFQAASEMLKNLGYDASFGVRCRTGRDTGTVEAVETVNNEMENEEEI